MFKKWQLAAATVIGLANAAHAEEHMIVITGFSYFPAVTYAKPGDLVRFINQSGESQMVVGKDTGWMVGPLQDQQEAILSVDEETELSFFAAYGDWNEAEGPSDDDADYGDYEDAVVRAEIIFDSAPVTE